MSRIEEAMEKAKLLREKEVNPPPRVSRKAKLAPLPKPVSPLAQLEIKNPLLLGAADFDISVAEEYRKLKTIVAHAMKKEGLHNTLMVTSSVSGEGKSLTALNLAITLAQEHDHTVLLVDADLRSPTICEYLGLEARKGFADCLLEGMDMGEGLIRTGVGNLTILPAGRRVLNPVELFSSQKTRDLLYEIKHRYADRYIIFDMPPVLPFAETRLLGAFVDGVVFVVKEGGASLQNITDALASLKDANVLGLVYNEATAANIDSGYYGDYAKYRYGPQRNNLTTARKSKSHGFFAGIRKSIKGIND